MMFRQFHFELSTDFEVPLLQVIFHTYCNQLAAERNSDAAAARELFFKVMQNSCEIERSFSTPFDDNKKTTNH